MKTIQFQFSPIQQNVDLLAFIISQVIKTNPSVYFYLGNICSYSKYDGNSPSDIVERQQLIDFNAEVNFRHFKKLETDEMFDYLYRCEYIEECRLICSEHVYNVEQLYQQIDQEEALIFSLELIEGDLYQFKFDPKKLGEHFFDPIEQQYLSKNI